MKNSKVPRVLTAFFFFASTLAAPLTIPIPGDSPVSALSWQDCTPEFFGEKGAAPLDEPLPANLQCTIFAAPLD